MTLKPIPITLNTVKVMAAYTLEKAAEGERAPKKRRLCPKSRHQNKAQDQDDQIPGGPHLSTLSC